LGFAADEARDPEAMLAQGYRGSRYSFGYPACPNLDQKQLLALLGAEEIGITLSEEDQLDPSNRPRRSSSTTRRRNIFRSDVPYRGETRRKRCSPMPSGDSEIFSPAPPNSSLPRA
jgi:Vitamin B12 dependent methionine synthase, activation domain